MPSFHERKFGVELDLGFEYYIKLSTMLDLTQKRDVGIKSLLNSSRLTEELCIFTSSKYSPPQQTVESIGLTS